MNIIEVKDLVRNYKTEDKEIEVLKGLNFAIEKQDFIGVMGRSGCGKTTLLKTLGLIEWETAGKIFFWGKDRDELSVEEEAELRRNKIGFIFQDYFLMNTLTIKENMMLPMAIADKPRAEMEKLAKEYAEAFGISHLLEKSPYEVSGGERQRVAICRALMNSPEVIFADEPTGNLDSKSGNIVVQELEEINEKYGKTIFMVTHDPKVASHCKTIIFLKDGQILKTIKRQGSTEEFYKEIINCMDEI